ncbi:MAG: SPFH domain-containing protein [Planctomycetes bacterium]|nr:SPFH domain-containing protein [Planctomycetota bacterium]
MLGIRFFKAQPTTWVIHSRNGHTVREGAGLSFFYFGPTASLAAVPLATTDLPFAFNEVAADFQPLTLQGLLTYRVSDPRRLAALLDFSVDSHGAWRTEDPERLRERLVHTTQVLARAEIQKLPLARALVSADAVVAEVLPKLRASEAVAMLGIEILALSVFSVRATPEMSRALEAEAREALHRNADQAIYDRRNAAVEQERRIKESELNTEIAVEEKKRRVRETQMAAEIAVEEQRAKLVDQRAANDRKDADAKGYALDTTLKPLKGIDWRILAAVGAGAGDPKASIALAFRELAENAAKIGELNITPDLLRALIGSGAK